MSLPNPLLSTGDNIPTHAETAPCRLDIIIVGAGLGGLSAAYTLGRAGHHVTLLEQATNLTEIGAGIQLGPNATRLLIRWGLGPQLEEISVVPAALTFRRYENGELFGYTRWGHAMQFKHGAPYYHLHRADLHALILNLAKPYMNLQLAAQVTSIKSSPSRPSVTLSNGRILEADMIIGADGVKSVVRAVIVGERDNPTPTGDAAYRAMVPASAMMNDPQLRELLDRGEMIGWLGPEKHIIGYSVRQKQEFNLVMIHPDEGGEESYTKRGSVTKMKQDYEGWEPRVQKLLGLVKSTLIWPLKTRTPLNTWLDQDGRIALLGDACHPMLPYRAQGSSMAIEDAAVLGAIFSHITSPAQIPVLLKAYEELRLPRATKTQLASQSNQGVFHMEDGPEQRARDSSMREAMLASFNETKLSDSSGNSNAWADEQKSKEQFDYDAEKEVDTWWEKTGCRLLDVRCGFEDDRAF